MSSYFTRLVYTETPEDLSERMAATLRQANNLREVSALLREEASLMRERSRFTRSRGNTIELGCSL